MAEEVKAEASLNTCDARLCDARYPYLTICTGSGTFGSCCCCLFFFFLNIPVYFHLRSFGYKLFRRQMAASKRQKQEPANELFVKCHRALTESRGSPVRVCRCGTSCWVLERPPVPPVNQDDGQRRHARSPNYNCWGVECLERGGRSCSC